MRRRDWLVSVALLLSGIGYRVTRADSPVAPGGPTLKTTLEKGLKARRPVEFEFIANVVSLVDNGTLPKSVVETSFLFARDKQPWPYPYFERALKLNAQKLGITL
jgi:hypothetical protein